MFVDVKPLAETSILRGGDQPQFLSIDLAGAKQLRLTAGETGEGIYNGHADWGGALLILKPDAKAKPQTVDLPKAAAS